MQISLIRLAFIALCCCLSTGGMAQGGCFEIESILVNACESGPGCPNNEGENEMVTFLVGAADLDTDDLDIDWPTPNSYLGICQNAQTASNVTQLNMTIQSCGFLREPVNNILPAGERVLLVTSEDMCVAANSFAGLTDTLYIIFQCGGNFLGHLSNNTNPGIRTLEMDFGPGCSDEVSYEGPNLVGNDGATVLYTPSGIPTYENFGCTAPFEQEIFDAGAGGAFCGVDPVALEGEASALYANPVWSGGLGTFSNPNSLITTYTPAAGDPDPVVLTLTMDGCDGPVTDIVQVQNLASALTGITADPGLTFCDGETVTLTAQGSSFFTWSTGVLAPSITVNSAGTYSVSVTNSCGTLTETIELTQIAAPTVDILQDATESICTGSDLTLDAVSTGGAIDWSMPGGGPNSLVVDAAGEYFASVTNGCATVSDSVTVEIIPTADVSIDQVGPLNLCEGATLDLSATGQGALTWSTGGMGATSTINTIGTVTVTAANDCGSDMASIEINFGGAPPVALISTLDDDLLWCPGDSILLTGSGGDDYAWNGTPADSAQYVYSDGLYELTVSNNCGIDQTSITIVRDEIADVGLIGGNEFALCNGEIARVEASGIGNLSWSDGSTGEMSTWASTGEYYVVSTAACGTDTAYFEIISDAIEALPSADPLLGEAPLQVTLTSLTENSAFTQWMVSGGDTLIGSEVQYTFNQDGPATVFLEVQSALGCISRAPITIAVGECPFSIYIPNAFTPDNDGVNDRLRVMGNCVVSYEWQIFDRNGRVLYSSTDITGHWDGGDVSGYAVTNGIYPYRLIVTDKNGDLHPYMGTVTVIR